MKTVFKFITTLSLFLMVSTLSYGQMIINYEAYQGPYHVYNLYGQKIASAEGNLSDIILPGSGIYVLSYQDISAKITTNLDGKITSFKIMKRDESFLDIAMQLQMKPINLEGSPSNRTKPVIVDSVDLSSLLSDRSLQSFVYCDSIALNRRDIPDFATSWNQLQITLATVPTDWQKYEIVSAWVYRTSDFKSDESEMAMDWFTWRDSMNIEDRYEYSRRDSGTVLCGNRAEQLSQILRDSFGVTHQMLYSLDGIHTVLLAQTSAGVWMFDPYYSNNYAEVRPMQHYGQILDESERTYPIDFISYLRKAKAGGTDLRLRQIPKSFGPCDDIKEDVIQLLLTDCNLVSQYLDALSPSQNPICDTCTGTNMSIWLPQRYFLTNENSSYNFKVLDNQNFLQYSQSGSQFPIGVTAETFFSYVGNGITFGIYPDADPIWTQALISEISNILQIPFTP